MAAGVALAVEHVNSSGGVRGVPVRVVTRWSDDPWRGGASDMVRLAYDDSVWVVLGAVGGDATHIAEQVATKAWVPLVAPASTDPTLTYIRIPWMFRLPPHDEVQARVLMDGITTRALTDVGMITSSDHDGRTFADAVRGAASASGTTMAFHFEVPPGDDLVAVARRAGAFRPGALIVRTSPSSLPTLLEGLVDAGVDVPLLIPWVPGLNPDLITRIYPGAVLAVQPFDERLNPAYAEFRRAYRARHESDPPPEAAYGYDAVRLVVSALEVSGLNRAALRDAIAAADFTGVTGPVAWDNAGGNRAKPVLLTVSGRMNHGGSPQGVGSARR
jgi:branched-chain amino acid transport system substrate-binding protein